MKTKSILTGCHRNRLCRWDAVINHFHYEQRFKLDNIVTHSQNISIYYFMYYFLTVSFLFRKAATVSKKIQQRNVVGTKYLLVIKPLGLIVNAHVILYICSVVK